MDFKSKFFNQLTTRELYEIIRARQEIFLIEQRIICRDFDGVDLDSLHCFLEKDGRVVAYLRAYMSDGEIHIGRVLTIRHGEGLGRRLMELSMPEIREAFCDGVISLHAQTQAEGFYAKMGFVTCSEVFLEEGIEHVRMIAEFRMQNAE